jgi:hypothetical protein
MVLRYVLAVATALILAHPALASEQGGAEPAPAQDAVPAPPFKTGDVIGFDQIDKLEGYIPAPFWENREFFFFEGMQLGIGEFNKDYGQTEAWSGLTQQYAGEARIGRDGSIENYSFGQPFPEIAADDPEAGAKYSWNLDYRHDALEGRASWHFTYWDNGDALPLWYKGTGWGMRLANRTDRADKPGGSFWDEEKRKGAGGITVKEPHDARGIIGLGYRYLSADAPRDEARSTDIWVYVPSLRRVRRISSGSRTDRIAGTDMTAEDQGGFSGIMTHFTWEHVGEADVLAPIDSRLKGYPYTEDENFGPLGVSLANDEWQLRRVMILEQRPKDDNHPYQKKVLWVDKQTYRVLYAAAYDRKGELWKLISVAHRWTESPHQETKVGEELRTFLPVVNTLINPITGTGVRVEYFDVRPTRLSRGKIRRQIDIGRLSREGR